MKKIQGLESGHVYSKPDLVFGYGAWPSVACDEDGNLLVAFSGGRIMHICPFGKVLVMKSRDQGHTWTSPCIAVDTPLDDRDAGILNLGNGHFMISTFNNTKREQEEWAKKAWFGNENQAALTKAYLLNLSGDQEKKYWGSLLSISVDYGDTWSLPYCVPVTAPHGPSILKDGSIIYAGTPFPMSMTPIEYPIAIYKSCDRYNFSKLADLPVCPQAPDAICGEPHIIELTSGRLVLHIRMDKHDKEDTNRIFSICQSISDDGGREWSIPKFIGAQGAPPHLLQHSSGKVICLYGRRKPPYGICGMISGDECNTWSQEYMIWDRGVDTDLGYPASVELGNGDIFSVFYAKKEGQRHCSILWTRWKLPE